MSKNEIRIFYFSQIICLYLKKFRRVIVRDNLWNPPDWISGWVVQFLFSKVNSISNFLTITCSNSLKFE
jgi:hypothetical protein